METCFATFVLFCRFFQQNVKQIWWRSCQKTKIGLVQNGLAKIRCKPKGRPTSFTIKRGYEKGSQKGFLEGDFQKVPRTPSRRV